MRRAAVRPSCNDRAAAGTQWCLTTHHSPSFLRLQRGGGVAPAARAGQEAGPAEPHALPGCGGPWGRRPAAAGPLLVGNQGMQMEGFAVASQMTQTRADACGCFCTAGMLQGVLQGAAWCAAWLLYALGSVCRNHQAASAPQVSRHRCRVRLLCGRLLHGTGRLCARHTCGWVRGRDARGADPTALTGGCCKPASGALTHGSLDSSKLCVNRTLAASFLVTDTRGWPCCWRALRRVCCVTARLATRRRRWMMSRHEQGWVQFAQEH